MKEQRQYKRFKVDLFGISGRMTFARDVRIIDMSPGGVALKTDRRLNVNGEYTLKMKGKSRELTIRGTVAWSIIHESITDASGNIIPIYSAGMQFADISDDKKLEIAGFIEEHRHEIAQEVFSLINLRINVRIQFDTPKEAVLHYHDNYNVKKISLGGMLIESQETIQLESRLPMELDLTGDNTVKFTGRVASCLLASEKDNHHYDIGVEFLDMSPEDRKVLHAFISALESGTPEPSSL